MSYSEPDPFDEARAKEEWSKEAKKIGRFNLAVLGKTGVGKSTLVNAIFGEEVAETGIGKPVTEGSHLYLTRSGALGLYDTRGLEIGSSTAELLHELSEFVETKRTKNPQDHIHIVYYCIRASDNRIEPTEEVLIRGLHDLGLPVFLVLTQVHKRGDTIRPEHLELADHLTALRLPVHSGRPFLTAALPDRQLEFVEFGLHGLLEATFDKVPEVARTALAAAQVLDRRYKRRAVTKRVAAAVTSATAVGATPVPFADAALLVPIQTAMMASISQVYGLRMDKTLAASLAATSLATNMGKSLVGSLLKLVPGAGSAVGGAISASVAGSFTLAMGTAWAGVCEGMLDGQFGPADNIDIDAVKDAFSEQFKKLFTESLKDLRKRFGPGRGEHNDT